MDAGKVISVLFTCIGVALLTICLTSQIDTRKFLSQAESAEGIVYDIKKKRGDSATYYYPMIRYEVPGGETYEYTSSLGSNPSRHHRGERVEVLYDPKNLEKRKLNSFSELWFVSMITAIMGSVFSGVGGGMIFYRYKQRKRGEELKHTGTPVSTVLKEVTGGRNVTTGYGTNRRRRWVPYRVNTVVASQLRVKEAMIYISDQEFRYNPEKELAGREVIVYVDKDNPNQYWMDTTFLPKRPTKK